MIDRSAWYDDGGYDSRVDERPRFHIQQRKHDFHSRYMEANEEGGFTERTDGGW